MGRSLLVVGWRVLIRPSIAGKQYYVYVGISFDICKQTELHKRTKQVRRLEEKKNEEEGTGN